MGLLAMGALSGFGKGLERAGELAAKTISEKYLMDERMKYETLRDERREAFTSAQTDKTIAAQATSQDKGILSQERMQEKTLGAQESLQEKRLAHETDAQTARLWSAEGASERQLKQADTHFEKSLKIQQQQANTSAGQLTLGKQKLTQDGTKILELADGTMAVYSVTAGKGKVQGFVTGPDGKTLRMKKNLTDLDKVKLESLLKEMTHTADQAKSQASVLWTPEQVADNNAKVADLQRRIQAFGEAAPTTVLQPVTESQAAQAIKANPTASDAEFDAAFAKRGIKWNPLFRTPAAKGGVLNSGPQSSYTPADQAEIDSAYERLKRGRAGNLP